MHVNLNINEDKILTASYSCGLKTKYFITTLLHLKNAYTDTCYRNKEYK